jgi:uncharacterized membrane protein YqjE
MSEGSGQPQGLLKSLRALGGTLVAIAHTRLAILATEIQEEQVRLARLAVMAAIAAVCFAAALALAVMFVVVLFWEDHRLAAIGILCVVFLATALGTLVALVRRSAERPRLFATTLAELEKDKAALYGSDESSH